MKKVKFKPDIFKTIKEYEGNDIWFDVKAYGVRQRYRIDFDVPYFIVKHHDAVDYDIVEPTHLSKWRVSIAHVEPYFDFEVKLDDELWNI